MREKLLQDAEKYTKQNQRQRIWRRFVQIMACVVVFCTTYALILPAITMEKLQCGKEEHIHSESCYRKVIAEPERLLVCTYESLDVHVHTSECYDSQHHITCGYADYVVHKHTDACKDENGTLVCQLPVVKEHIHTDDCYRIPEVPEQEPTQAVHRHSTDCYTESRGELICQTPATEGHSHDTACYTKGELRCQLSEQAAHTHDESCSETVLVCDLTVEPHNHGDSCYEQLVCELPEDETHTHSDECSGMILRCDLTEQPHNHTDACWQTRSLCDLSETEGHTHSNDCYEWILECELAVQDPHSHTDNCYEKISTLTCGLEEGSPAETEPAETTATEPAEPELVCQKEVIQIHSHEETCYETNAANGQKQLICTKPMVLEHVHGESCFVTGETNPDETDTLTCTLAEGHTHEESCYEESSVLTCTKDENHTHEESCYDEAGALICTKAENHTHEEDCYDKTSVLTCTAAENHTHSNLCYGIWEQICGKETHTHTAECYETVEIADPSVPAGPAQSTQETLTQTDIEDPTVPAVLNKTLSQTDASSTDSNYGIALMAVMPDEYVDGGEMPGTSFTWTLNKNQANEYTLIIDGEGSMPNYGSYESTAWKTACSGKSVKLVFGPNVTRIGNWSFAGMTINSIDWGNVSEIGLRAFQTGSGMTTLSFPGSIKIIGEGAFCNFNYLGGGITTLEFGHGVESIGRDAFLYNQVSGYSGASVHLPSTVKTVSGSPFLMACEITVDPDNPYYTSVDGVLFNKDMTTLIQYPTYKIMDEYHVPNTVTKIALGAFRSYFLDKVYLPNTVTTFENYSFNGSKIKEIYMEDGAAAVTLKLFIFNGSSQLRVIHFPENTALYLTEKPFNSTTYSSLESLKIPNGTKKLDLLGSVDTHFPVLKDLVYDASDAVISATSSPFHDAKGYVLTIGPSVDVLPDKFSTIVGPAERIVFAHDNSFEIKEGALNGAGVPLDTLSGTVHVDEQGVLYAYDAVAKTAQLVYCPPSVTQITVPDTITTEGGYVCTVTSVRKNSLYMADGLASITFAVPGNIQKLDALALANCPTLTSVNGKSTVEEASAIFNGVTAGNFGGNVFYNTGLTGAPGSGNFAEEMDGAQNLDITKEGATDMHITLSSSGSTTEWIPKEEGATSGIYRLLTGDTLTITGVVGNTEGNADNVYRIYFRVTSDDASLSITPGKSYTYGDVVVNCHATSDPYTIYLEFTPMVGKTSSIFATNVYPSPNSPGGGLSVWGTILSPQEAADKAGQIIEAQNENVIHAYWTTDPDEFKLEKSAVNPTKQENIVSGDSHGAKPAANITWNIVLSRTTENASSYGKDYVKSVDYVDVLTLPAGITWHPDVVAAVKSGNTTLSGTALYAGDVKVATLSCTGATLNSPRLVWDETRNTIVIRWRCDNSGVNVEMNTNTVTLAILPEALSINMQVFNQEGATIQNTVNAAAHYQHSEDANLTATAEKRIGGGAGTLGITKTSSYGQNTRIWFGTDVKYTIDVYNSGGLPFVINEGGYTVTDNLNVNSYITPANMIKMFQERPGLEIKIENAILATWTQVKGAYGDTAWENSGNTGKGTANQTLTITYDNGAYTVIVEGGKTSSKSDLAVALQEVGYAVHFGDQYTCTWRLGQTEQPFTVDPGSHSLFYIYATFKDTFRCMESQDYPNEWPYDSEQLLRNYAYLNSENINKSANALNTLRREAILTKSVSKDGQALSKLSARHGDVLDYHLNFSHIGTGSYDNLPLVDDLYGSQYLLAPVIEANAHLSGCAVHTDKDGKSYYILREGNYTNVTVGVDDAGTSLIAARIEVRPAKNDAAVDLGGQTITYSGSHTTIKWYFSHLNGGNYLLTVSYKALVDLSQASMTYTLGNVAWLNDDPGSRLYASLWGDGTILDFEKHIVTEKDPDDPGQDDLTDYSTVGPGESVTYRITLRNTNNVPYNLKGSQIADALPNNYSVFNWSKGANVVLTDIRLSDSSITHSGLDSWYLGTSYQSLQNVGQQYILWPEETTIHFEKASTLYLYFKLTYPDKTGENLWERYAAEVDGSTLQNTWFLYTFTSAVEHDLRETGHVLLQKGVHGMYHHATSYGWHYVPSGKTRYYYSNRDDRERSVAYYVTLYNGGGKRLYLNDLHDRLPDGFTYNSMWVDGDVENAINYNREQIETLGGYAPFNGYPLAQIGSEAVLYRSARIYAEPTENGVTFKFGPGSGDYAVSYDSVREQYYLNSGEAIVFAYACDIGTTEQTSDDATNVIAMAYTDYLNTGLELIDSDELSVVSAGWEPFLDYNDGERYIKSGQQVSQDYGFVGNETDWLVSNVTVHRGGIVPGVTKSTVSYTQLVENSIGQTTLYTNSVPPTENYLVNWEVKLHNSGTLTLQDYTFTDIMPSPYVFQWNLSFTKYDSLGNSLASEKLFEILARNEGDSEITIVDGKGEEHRVKLDGTPVSILCAFNSITAEFNLSISKNADGNEVLCMDCYSPGMSIPEGGYVLLQLSSRNPTTTYQNTVYTNRAQLVPNVQPFENVGQGSMIRDENNNPHGAENASPVTVSFGYSTSSSKQVTEKNHPNNTAASTDTDDRSIILESRESVITYTLNVGNDTDIPMTKLVLIDNLPEVNDHSPFRTDAKRHSEFGVSLASTPNFRVVVTPHDSEQEPIELAASDFTVQFSTDTNFGEKQGPDWRGDDEGTTAVWTSDPQNARSIRLIIRDATGTKIPAKSNVAFYFDAVVNSDADPGEIAWNSFGYHYGLKDVNDVELEAMPLTVGVAVPSVPSVRKQLVAPDGTSANAAQDLTFSFLVYEGEALTGTYETTEALYNALTAAGRGYKVVTVPVAQGNSESDEVMLNGVPWTWTTGNKYTITEIGTTNKYAFNRFNGTTNAQYTFAYDSSFTQTAVCENRLEEWSIRVDKTNVDGDPLSGAVFGLYSPSPADQLSADDAAAWGAQQSIQIGEKTWYLKSIVQSGADGVLSWTGLLEDSYYLLEIKAPDGYNLLETGKILYRSDSTDGVRSLRVINRPGYELPKTGGAGTTSYTLGGLLLMAAAILLYIHNQKRRKEEMTSF